MFLSIKGKVALPPNGVYWFLFFMRKGKWRQKEAPSEREILKTCQHSGLGQAAKSAVCYNSHISLKMVTPFVRKCIEKQNQSIYKECC